MMMNSLSTTSSSSSSSVHNNSSSSSAASPHNNFICVQCGEPADSLFIEYSENNFRLTRCPHCLQVVDRYIEYELLLVLMEIIMHRPPAYRHLLYNRYTSQITLKASKWLPLAVLLTGVILKLLILRKTIYTTPSIMTFVHVCISTVIELVTFFGTIAGLLNLLPTIRRQLRHSSHPDILMKVYFSLLFPEIFRSIAIMLYVFEVESELLFLLGMVILSIQHEALQSVLNIKSSLAVIVVFILAVLARLLVKMVLYKTSDLILLGGLT